MKTALAVLAVLAVSCGGASPACPSRWTCDGSAWLICEDGRAEVFECTGPLSCTDAGNTCDWRGTPDGSACPAFLDGVSFCDGARVRCAAGAWHRGESCSEPHVQP